MTGSRRWMGPILLLLILCSVNGANAEDQVLGEAIVPPDADSLVRAILRGGDADLKSVALWFRIMRPEDIASALERLRETIKLEVLLARTGGEQASGRVRGTVRDETGSLVPATACLKRVFPNFMPSDREDVAERILRARSSHLKQSGGSFDFGALQAGYYSLSARVGVLRYWIPTLRVANLAVTADIRLGAGSLDVQVLDRKSVPVAGTVVLAQLPGVMWVEAETDVHGRIRLKGLPAGRWSVGAGNAYTQASEGLLVSVRGDAVVPVRLRVQLQAVLEVHVVDSNGQDVPGTTVRLRRVHGVKHVELGGVTDVRGMLREALVEGTWLVDVADGRQTSEVEIVGGVDRTIVVMLK